MGVFTAIDNKAFSPVNGPFASREQIESEIRKMCHYVQYVVLVQQNDRNYSAVIFPNMRLFQKPDYEKTPEEGCFCPRSIEELGKCLTGCFYSLNRKLENKNAAITSGIIINAELSVYDGTLSPAFAVNAENVLRKYRPHITNLFGEKTAVKEEIFVMKLM